MKVTVCTVDQSAVSQYRLRQPVAALQAAGESIDLEIVDKIPLMADPDTKEILGFGHSLDCDVLVLHLPMFQWVPRAIEQLQARGIKVVVELDDDFQALHPRHMSYYLVHPAHCPPRNWRHLLDCCYRADLVTASTPALARRYAPHGRYAVLRNYVSEKLLEIPHRGNGRTVGWSGGVGVHPNDLQETRGGVAAAVEECDAKFLCVGGGKDVKRNLSLRQDPETTGWVDLSMYPALLARLDVGIVPLADTRFNAAKSWLKGIEYAAVGVPFVASGVTEYRKLQEYRLGTIVSSKARSWRREVKQLLQDDELRRELSEHGREVVRDHFTIEDNAWRWAEAWTSVLDREEAMA